jgi:hypothetical protein
MKKVRHVLGLSGGKDSAALAIYLKDKYPEIPIEFYNCDTKCELTETVQLIEKLRSYLGHITTLIAAKGSPEPTPFDHFLKTSGGFLPSPQARWCTQKMKLAEFEKYVGNDLAVSYVGIRGDEEREGYVSTKPNIQSIFPFRRNIWSLDVTHKAFSDENRNLILKCYQKVCSTKDFDDAKKIILTPLSNNFYYSKKINTLLDIDVKTFNKTIFEFLHTTDYPVGQLDNFPLVENDDIIVKDDVFKILRESGVGVPAYYNLIDFEVEGKKGKYCRSRSGCYFCFFQQRIEWIWLYEQHPDLFKKAMAYEKDGYTWIQGEKLQDLIEPQRIKQIKLDYIKKTDKNKIKSNLLVDIFDDDDAFCANCFI